MDAFHPREEAVNYDNGWTSASECNPTVNFIISITTENSSILMTYANLKSLKRILMILWIFHMWRYNSNQTSTMKKRNPNHKDKRKQDHKTKLRTGLNNSDSHMHIQVYWSLSSSVLAQNFNKWQKGGSKQQGDLSYPHERKQELKHLHPYTPNWGLKGLGLYKWISVSRLKTLIRKKIWSTWIPNSWGGSSFKVRNVHTKFLVLYLARILKVNLTLDMRLEGKTNLLLKTLQPKVQWSRTCGWN
jgi:hypothetical protein